MMKRTMRQAAFLAGAAAIASGAAGPARAGALTLDIDTGEASGTLFAAAYDSQASFDDRELVAGAAGPANGGPATVTFGGLAPGTYGIAVFLDTNGNGELDRNLFGMPTEPYGFSTNPKIRFSAPKFDAFRFEHDGGDRRLAIELNGG